MDTSSDDQNALSRPDLAPPHQPVEFDDGPSRDIEARKLEAAVRQAMIQSEHHLRKLDLQNKNDGHKRTHEYGMTALKFQAEAFNEKGKERRRESTKRYLFSGFIILVGVVAMGYLVRIGQTSFAEKILQVGAGLLGGTGIGYAFGVKKGKASRKEENEE